MSIKPPPSPWLYQCPTRQAIWTIQQSWSIILVEKGNGRILTGSENCPDIFKTKHVQSKTKEQPCEPLLHMQERDTRWVIRQRMSYIQIQRFPVQPATGEQEWQARRQPILYARHIIRLHQANRAKGHMCIQMLHLTRDKFANVLGLLTSVLKAALKTKQIACLLRKQTWEKTEGLKSKPSSRDRC